jgi:hypothetical protein
MAEPESQILTSDQVSRLIEAVSVWVELHPNPDYEAFAFGDSEPFSPRKLLIDLYSGGPLAQQFLRMTRFALEEETFERIVGGFSQRATDR